MKGLETYHKSVEGMNEVYTPKNCDDIQFIINTSNKFVTIKTPNRKDRYDRLKPAEPLIAELDRLMGIAVGVN